MTDAAIALPINTWRVKIETRKQGAIGQWVIKVVYIKAELPDVSRYAMDDVRAEGLEPGRVMEIRRAR